MIENLIWLIFCVPLINTKICYNFFWMPTNRLIHKMKPWNENQRNFFGFTVNRLLFWSNWSFSRISFDENNNNTPKKSQKSYRDSSRFPKLFLFYHFYWSQKIKCVSSLRIINLYVKIIIICSKAQSWISNLEIFPILHKIQK